jgi:hypothetical protein
MSVYRRFGVDARSTRRAKSILALALCSVSMGCVVSPDESLWKSRVDASSSDSNIIDGAVDARGEGTVQDTKPSHDSLPPSGTAVLFYGAAGSGDLNVRTWGPQATAWSAPAAVAAASGIHWTVNRFSENDATVGVLYKGITKTALKVLRLQGSGWAEDWTSTAVASVHADKRSYDLEYERSSGDLLVVYSNDTKTPVYRTHSGSSWSAEAPLPIDLNTGVVLWVELVPRRGSDEIALLYADDQADLVVADWDGKSWKASSAKVLETDLKTNPFSMVVNNRAFDGAFETSSGDLLVAWGTGSAGGFHWSTRTGSGWTAPVNDPIVGGYVEHVELASGPAGDLIAGVFLDLGNGTERLGLAFWDGSQWTDQGEYDSQIRDVNDNAHGDFLADVSWSTSDTAVCIYADDQAGTIDWAEGTPNGGWVVQTDVTVSGKGLTESVQIAPTSGTGVMALVSDDQGELFSLTYDGTSWEVTNSAESLGSLSSKQSRPFSFAVLE